MGIAPAGAAEPASGAKAEAGSSRGPVGMFEHPALKVSAASTSAVCRAVCRGANMTSLQGRLWPPRPEWSRLHPWSNASRVPPGPRAGAWQTENAGRSTGRTDPAVAIAPCDAHETPLQGARSGRRREREVAGEFARPLGEDARWTAPETGRHTAGHGPAASSEVVLNADLQRFVHDALARGLTRDAIAGELREAGWRGDEIEAALAAWRESGFPVPVPRRRPSLNARETFLYLVLFATLYTSAFNTGQVLFALAERWFPDPLRAPTYWRPFGEWVRGATAGILIAFPIFLFLSRAIGREVAAEPVKLGSPIRKWLTYLTLFIAALVIIGALTVVVTRVLGGEAPPRFLLKVTVVLLIAAEVFGHYLGQLRHEEDQTGRARGPSRLLARLAAGAVFAAAVVGLLLSGTPGLERTREFDVQRVEALHQISNAIGDYYQARGELPGSLTALLEIPNGVGAQALLDPAGGRRYGYRTVDSLTYELCAEFGAADVDAGRPMAEFWRHGAGRKCFRFEMSPRRAPVTDLKPQPR